ncbi:MAG: hypothetical protein ACE37B_20015 [Ilumatobacter sp.]|uniref:hypothetical protein n=1 Tax=Ilumatobacter sp. TaxID=1967498 RepID=UPI003918BF81
MIEREGPQEHAERRGAITRCDTTISDARARNMAGRSMWEPLASTGFNNVNTLRPDAALPTPPSRRTVELLTASTPRRSINVAGNHTPAFATRLSSSKVA